MTQSDPTDSALAAIASILDHADDKPEASLTTEAGHEAVAVTTPAPDAAEPRPVPPAATDGDLLDVENYSRQGPGPLDAIRFRWTARRDEDGQYFVDETIGPNSRPLSAGPMPKHEVVAFIDSRESAARRRFDALKSEMTVSRPLPVDVPADIDSEDRES